MRTVTAEEGGGELGEEPGEQGQEAALVLSEAVLMTHG